MKNIQPGELRGEYENFTSLDEIDMILMAIAVDWYEVVYIWVALRTKVITIEPMYPDDKWTQTFTKWLK